MESRKFISFFILVITTFIYETTFSQLKDTKVDWKAHWITAGQSQSATNTWISFRKDFELKEIPLTALSFIAVDSKYWLWVNGKMVIFEGGLKRGPNSRDTYYDEIDIAKFFRKGENTIAILLWYFGKDGFSHNSSGKAGLLFQCVMPELAILSDKSWKATLNSAYEMSPPPHPNYRLPESNVYYNAMNDLGKWQSGAYRPEKHGFSSAQQIGVPPCFPWNNLIKRSIPQWKNFGLQNYVSKKITSGKESDTIICQLPYNSQITPYFMVAAPEGKAIKMQTDDYEGGGALNVRAGYITLNGQQEYESYGWMNGNKVYYIIPKGVKVMSLKYRETGYDTEFSGSFKSNDAFLNRLWEKARRTLYVTMRDTYMDCPDRERAQWIGDVVNESGEAFYALDTKSHLLQKKSMYELIGWQRKDSTLFSPIPSGNWDKELPSQILAAVGYYGFWNYYLNTGDIKPIADLYDNVQKYIAVFKLSANGTIVFREGGWNWGDWGDNIDTVLLENAWYYLALKGIRNMARVLKKSKEADEYEKSMEKFKINFNREFWNGIAYRSSNYKSATDDRGQALAIVSGLADRKKFPELLEVFKKEEHASPYMEKYVLESLFLMDNPDYALSRMRKRFDPMVNNNNYSTLFEGWGIGTEGFGGGTFNHAWSGGGLTILSQFLCGISPIKPGYEIFEVKPRMGDIISASASVATVKGKINLSIRKTPQNFLMTITVPRTAQGLVFFPRKYSKIYCDGKRIKTKKQQGFHFVLIGTGTFHFTAKK